jgi:Fur family iron response transcriptional regulator
MEELLGRRHMSVASTLQSERSDQDCWVGGSRCPTLEMGIRLRTVGLRPTRQRIELARLLFADGNRHVTAEILQADAELSDINVSPATVYNTLQQFTDAGLMRRLAIDGPRTWFDTNVSEHHHFYVEDDDAIVDIPDGQLNLACLPEVPDDIEIVRVEVVVKVRKRRSASHRR